MTVLGTSAELNGVVPPTLVVLAVEPAAPADLSQARKVIFAVPLKFASGTKRTLWLALAPSSNREETVLALKFVKVEPFVENCHWPLLLSVKVMATPVMVPLSTSVEAAAFRKVETASPLLVAGSSGIVVKALSAVNVVPLPVKFDDPAAVNTGASFIPSTLIVNVLVRVSTPSFVVPLLSFTSTLTIADPLVLGAGVKVS